MKRKQKSRIITIGGIVAIAVLVGFMISLQVEVMRNNKFKRGFEKIVIDVNTLTQQYQGEESKWQKNYDNSTMISVINQYLPKYQELIDRAEALDTPERYKESQGYLVSAIESEKQSNEHFRNYLVTGDKQEYDRSSDLLTKSLTDSANADAAIKAAG
ncbi:MAG: hypothetical protein E6K88_06505 [Thaumarchaeota archaeon]|nr:MAG: hypothetical protein E6K88_06505 [Nitrososphaerota archaeon]